MAELVASVQPQLLAQVNGVGNVKVELEDFTLYTETNSEGALQGDFSIA